MIMIMMIMIMIIMIIMMMHHRLSITGITLNSLHVQTLTLTDVQTSFLGTLLVPLKHDVGS